MAEERSRARGPEAALLDGYPHIPWRRDDVNLRRERNRFESGEIDAAALAAAYDATVLRVLREQEAAGLDPVTDGQVRQDDLLEPLVRDLAGLAPGGLVRYYDNNFYYRAPRVTGRIAPLGMSLAGQTAWLVRRTERRVKVVLPGPLTATALVEDEHYHDRERLLADVSRALHLLAAAAVEAGAAVVQLDEPELVRPQGEERRRALADRAAWLAEAREATRRVTEGLGVRTQLALFFGDAAPLLDALGDWPVDDVLFDLASGPAAADRLAAEGFPRGVGLGCLDARQPRLESVEEIERLVERLSARVAPERMTLHPSASLEFLPAEKARAKLLRLGEALAAIRGDGR
ncbi:MAG: hypothetical protein IRZ26_06490 [Clostridia bacterium]|nr:hypothetical protein [Clostridia bacterium]MCL6521113.1 hypothetical protein [Bacillota bacterium]